MDKQTLTAAANRFVQAFGDGAHGAIGAWREGGERLGRFAGERWDTAFAQSRAQLSAAGATVAVDTVVQAAQAALQQHAVRA
jgi:hypothetical protein